MLCVKASKHLVLFQFVCFFFFFKQQKPVFENYNCFVLLSSLSPKQTHLAFMFLYLIFPLPQPTNQNSASTLCVVYIDWTHQPKLHFQQINPSRLQIGHEPTSQVCVGVHALPTLKRRERIYNGKWRKTVLAENEEGKERKEKEMVLMGSWAKIQ